MFRLIRFCGPDLNELVGVLSRLLAKLIMVHMCFYKTYSGNSLSIFTVLVIELKLSRACCLAIMVVTQLYAYDV